MAGLKLSDLPKPVSVQDSKNKFQERIDRVVLHYAPKSKLLQADFAVDAETAMKLAMCKLELCRRDQKLGGSGELPRQIPAAPSPRIPTFIFDGKTYEDEITTFDPVSLPLPSGPVTLLSNRELVNKVILSWKSDIHIGTDFSIKEAILLLGGHYALLMLALSLGISVFVYIASLLLATGVSLTSIYLLPGVALIIGLVYGTIKAIDCFKKGDYDMAMMGLFPIIYRYRTLLDKDPYNHILHELLRKHVWGGANKVHEVNHICGTKVLPSLPQKWMGETENHILMIETARFLTNQLLLLPNPAVPSVFPPYDPALDNSVNGMREWMLEHLQKYLQNDFWEFNSRMYARLVALALENLYEFSFDPDVKKAARIVLDYLSAKFAVTNNGLRRAVPFRRLSENRDKSALFDYHSDAEAWRFAILAGNVQMLNEIPPDHEEGVLNYHSYTLVTAALSHYRVPELLLDLMLMPKPVAPSTSPPNRYLQLIRHGKWDHGYGDPAMEIAFCSKSYLITGGGLFADGRASEQAWALPTTLMLTVPSKRGLDWKDLLRIEGTIDERRRANTGVAPGFACGLNPNIPDWMFEFNLPHLVDTTNTNWTFFNWASNEYPFGVYVVVFARQCDTGLSKELAGETGTFGFFAVVEAKVGHDNQFTNFITDVMALNASKTYSAEGTNNFKFPTGLGGEIDFVCIPTQNGNYEPHLWPIVKINGKPVERRMNNWDLATSSVYFANGMQTSLEDWIIRSDQRFGCIMVDNPRLDHRLVLDFSDAMNPRLAYVMGNRFDAGCRCPLSHECERRHPIK